jgi:transglutaminase/protease-like cytokinesis protein 3
MSADEIILICNYILLDNPIIFYISSNEVVSDYGEIKCFINPIYKYQKNFIRENVKRIKDSLKTFDVIKDKNDFEKELHVHDYCIRNFSYDNSFNDFSFSVLGCILNKSAVCEGIAKFVKLALDYCGIQSLVVIGEAHDPSSDSNIDNHAWNIVAIQGDLYHLDATFDMTLKGKMYRYDYFNLSDWDIKKDHIINSNAPACTMHGKDYYSIHSLMVRSLTELEKYVKRFLILGEKHIAFKLIDTMQSEAIVDKVTDTALEQYINLFNCNAAVEVSYNLNQMVFELEFK